jgi:Cu+-exporting ATPase
MCNACTTTIEKAVIRIPGVLSVSSILSEGVTSVLFDDMTVSRSTIVEVIEGVGFEVE